jgi:hypothetical protein
MDGDKSGLTGARKIVTDSESLKRGNFQEQYSWKQLAI